jgi:hypothetical protein
VNSAWFRIGGRIDVNEWSSDPQWLGRCNPPNRWLSTNHLVGEGYWVWLIPLASGSHSVGIVADGRIHPLNRINSYGRALEWLREFQPRWRRTSRPGATCRRISPSSSTSRTAAGRSSRASAGR